MDSAHHDVRTPLPRKPRLSRTREGIRVGSRKSAGREDSFAGSDMPPGIRVPKQPLIALKNEQAIEEGYGSYNERQVRNEPQGNRPHIDVRGLLRGSADARQVSRDALVEAHY